MSAEMGSAIRFLGVSNGSRRSQALTNPSIALGLFKQENK
jgi:hypothetical protein